MAATLPGCRDVAPHGCVYDDVDAIAAAAAYLHDLGAGRALDARAWNAARAYNGAPAYADLVMAWARQYATAVGAFDGQLPVDPLGGSTETTPGVRARLAPNGLAVAPNDAPAAVQRAIAAANAISDRPYLEVHYPTHIDNPTYDCSSATSHVLWGAGAFGVAPWVSSALMRYGEPGPGRWITVYANTGHAFVVVAGLRFDTSRLRRGRARRTPARAVPGGASDRDRPPTSSSATHRAYEARAPRVGGGRVAARRMQRSVLRDPDLDAYVGRDAERRAPWADTEW